MKAKHFHSIVRLLWGSKASCLRETPIQNEIRAGNIGRREGELTEKDLRRNSDGEIEGSRPLDAVVSFRISQDEEEKLRRKVSRIGAL